MSILWVSVLCYSLQVFIYFDSFFQGSLEDWSVAGVEAYIKKGADVKATEGEVSKYFIKNYACSLITKMMLYRASVEVIKALLDNGAEVNAADWVRVA